MTYNVFGGTLNFALSIYSKETHNYVELPCCVCRVPCTLVETMTSASAMLPWTTWCLQKRCTLSTLLIQMSPVSSTPCFVKKEPFVFVRRKQTSRCKIVKRGSFTGF